MGTIAKSRSKLTGFLQTKTARVELRSGTVLDFQILQGGEANELVGWLGLLLLGRVILIQNIHGLGVVVHELNRHVPALVDGRTGPVGGQVRVLQGQPRNGVPLLSRGRRSTSAVEIWAVDTAGVLPMRRQEQLRCFGLNLGIHSVFARRRAKHLIYHHVALNQGCTKAVDLLGAWLAAILDLLAATGLGCGVAIGI